MGWLFDEVASMPELARHAHSVYACVQNKEEKLVVTALSNVI